MKKASIKVLLAAMLTSLVLVSCSSGSTMKDGTYKAQFDTVDSHGWNDYVEVTVQDGKIVAATYDSLDEAGNKKTENADYNASMKQVSGTSPIEYSPIFGEQLVEKQDPDMVDTIAGATDSSSNFKKLVKDLEKNMKSGKTEILNVKR